MKFRRFSGDPLIISVSSGIKAMHLKTSKIAFVPFCFTPFRWITFGEAAFFVISKEIFCSRTLSFILIFEDILFPPRAI